jgi:hypothetical protein
LRVILGGNQFIDCHILMSIRGTPLLRVSFNPLHVELTIPDDLPRPSSQLELKHVTTERSDAVFASDNHAVAVATLLDPETSTAHLLLDLRPIGINIFDDVSGLHIGTNLFSGNVVKGAGVAINLG